MAIPLCFPKTTLSFIMLLVLLMSMGVNRVVKAQAGRLPDDEGASFSEYAYGFFFFCNLWIEVSTYGVYSNKTDRKLPSASANIWVFGTEQITVWCVLMCAMEALREIATQLGKKDWNFSVNPCTDSSWRTPSSNERPLYNNTVNCNCTYPDGVCHVVNMYSPFTHITPTLFLLKFLIMMVNGKKQ